MPFTAPLVEPFVEPSDDGMQLTDVMEQRPEDGHGQADIALPQDENLDEVLDLRGFDDGHETRMERIRSWLNDTSSRFDVTFLESIRAVVSMVDQHTKTAIRAAISAYRKKFKILSVLVAVLFVLLVIVSVKAKKENAVVVDLAERLTASEMNVRRLMGIVEMQDQQLNLMRAWARHNWDV